jgi:hypothetical protein
MYSVYTLKLTRVFISRFCFGGFGSRSSSESKSLMLLMSDTVCEESDWDSINVTMLNVNAVES